MAATRRRRARRNTRNTRTARRRPVPGWIWLAGGLLIGAAGGYLAWLLQSSSGDPAPVEPAAQAQPAPPPAKPAAAAKKQPEAPQPSTSERSRFEFYTLLPEMEIEVSDAHVSEALKTPARKADAGPYILQVGSFRRIEEADNLKARIALLGIEAQIQTVVIRDSDVWYRVRVGPYDSVRDLAQARTRLQRNDIEAMVLRLGT
ncbi:MAG: SPOR domain-containing protein [Gammaproteobacteria bacterium]|jgi:cell division protein FtsN|nr:SPOR domain-containing protein [Gammaproteobacteria bacterium]